MFRLKRIFSKKFIFLLAVIYSLHLITGWLVHPNLYSYKKFENKQEKVVFRNSDILSPFNLIHNKREILLKTDLWTSIKEKLLVMSSDPPVFNGKQNLIANWNTRQSKKDKLKKCQMLISTMYYSDPQWNNTDIVKYYSNDNVDNTLLGLLGERMRIYDFCFLKGGLNTLDVFNSDAFETGNIDAWDYQSRMFPFLNSKFEKDSKQMWPKIRDLSTDDHLMVTSNPPNIDISFNDFNSNFWANWLKYSNAKGIVTTMTAYDVTIFKKQLQVFQKLNNTLPVQLVTTGRELSEDTIDEIANISKALNQRVIVVDCSPILDDEFSGTHIVNFLNKWIAVIMNTFEEAIFIDVDAVPFQATETFFNITDYKSSGIYMYQDRNLEDERTFQYCIDMLGYMEPSLQEKELLETKLFIDKNYHDVIVSAEAKVYQNFFKKHQLHHVESGLIVFNKKKKLNGLLMSFMMHLDAKMRMCVYGDKEIFWLGELFAGEDYSIDPVEGGLVGVLGENILDENLKKSHICAAQIAHCDLENNLVWTNGGLKTCKIENSAEMDFESSEDYYKNRYSTVENLRKIYDSPLVIQAMIVPDTLVSPWMQISECSRYMYCAFVTQGSQNTKLDTGKVVRFNEEQLHIYNSIVAAWSE